MHLALAAFLISSTPCARPALLPAELPLLACPLRATPARCTAHCAKTGQYLDLHYDHDDANALAAAWRQRLDAEGWRTRKTRVSLDPDRPGEPRRPAIVVRASKGTARLSSVVMPAAAGELVLALTFTPSS